ncbi:SusD/RagB family nutrient-binding outer membrane lipoprotein [Fibrisoma montanum]|uniref:SusD/RagB family nutrient-binding outer membrane lipoprotein n=1 Tax=Fibrisoma montanum TaxID=2305895 RepID=A0A418M498_9BACT|nr:SusD/RagB family nutrient-binding outer membrane lipoprotein [Fibrisoma montanum]RIV20484.1 SusD/RagB family nutrient-binding outer membrane lipoprotein [Fibrisoma montanum]
MKSITYILSILFLLVVTSCDNEFEQINNNPNVPTQVSPDLLLAGVIRNTINDQVNEAWGIGNIVVQHTAKIQFVNEDRYLWGERNGVWNSVYGNMRNVQNIISLATASQQNNYLGVGLVLKSWLFSIATDTYGDIPYADATKAKSDGVYAPKYDTQEVVYNGILADLKRANEILGTSSESISGDILFGGGSGAIIKWRKLANSLRIRYLMRISNRRNVGPDLQEILSDQAKFPIFESNADNAALVYQATAPNQWPLYGSRVGSFDEFRASKPLVDRLTALNDPRLPIFARPVERPSSAGRVEYTGIPNGLGDTPALSYNGGPQGVSRVGLSFACLVCSTPAPVPNVMRGLLMTFAELQFLLAEAREKGLITTGSAETYYLDGIRANFDFYRAIVPTEYGINVTPPATYFTQPGVAYTGTQQEKLQKIGTQKWVALFFNGLEAWFDWRRTGIPTVTPGPDNLNNNRVPVRYPYPLNEQSLNGTNRTEAVTRQGTDDINTPVWWDK